MNLKGNRRIISAIVAVAIVFALLAAVLVLIVFDNSGVFAKESKNLWKNNSNVTWNAGTATTNSSSSQEIIFNSKMLTDDNFNIKFKINSDGFDKLKLTFTSPSNVKSSSPDDVINEITLLKGDSGKIDVLVNDQDDDNPTSLNIDFKRGTEIEFKIQKKNENENNFTINGTAINDNKKYSFYLDLITEFRVEMSEIDSTASLQFMQICGKDISGTFNDEDAPVYVVDESLMPEMLIAGTWFTVPVYYFDLFDNNFYNKNDNNTDGRSVVDLVVTKYTDESIADGVMLPSSDIKVITSTQKLSFRVDAGYYYEITLKLNDGAGNTSTYTSPSRIQAISEDNTAPEFGKVEFKDVEKDIDVNTFVEVGEAINFARPEVSDKANGVLQNANRIRVFIQSKKSTENSSAWSPSIDTMKKTSTVNNLTFTPASTNESYVLRFVAVDEKGNVSYSNETFTISRVQDTVVPTMKVKDFPEKGYLNDTLNLPSATVEDKGTIASREIKVYKGTEINEDKLVKLTGNAFVPDELGTYTVVYTAKDGAGNSVSETKTLEVVPFAEKPVTTGSDNLSAFEIVMICIASLCALEIVYLLIPKKNKKKAKKK